MERAQLIAFLATRESERCRAFYEGALGLRLVADDEHALVFDDHGTMLRIQKVGAFEPHPFTALGWRVDDIGRAIAELEPRGVRFERFAGMPQDDRGVWTAPSGARVAWFKDPVGNV